MDWCFDGAQEFWLDGAAVDDARPLNQTAANSALTGLLALPIPEDSSLRGVVREAGG